MKDLETKLVDYIPLVGYITYRKRQGNRPADESIMVESKIDNYIAYQIGSSIITGCAALKIIESLLK